MKYTLKEIASISGGVLFLNQNDNSCDQVLTDTRSIVKQGGDGIFFAISGKNHDGHAFIGQAWQKGVRNFVAEKESAFELLPEKFRQDSSVLIVPDCLETLQKLAAFHRKQYHLPVTAITGSNGKTIIKEWLYQLLYREKSIYRSPKSYNSQLGVPLSVLGLNDNYDLGIFEAGISMPGEMEKLQTIICPDTGIFTNIGQAHQENFSSLKQKIDEKLLLFKNSRLLIFRADDSLLENEIRLKKANGWFTNDINLLCWSTTKEADFRITSILKTKYDTLISAVFHDQEIKARIPFTDDASVENAIHCWFYLLLMNVQAEEAAARLLHLAAVEMRLELKEGINNCTLLNDSYNSDINSLAIALDFLNQQNQHSAKTLILSDIFQSGLDTKALYQKVSGILESKGLQKLIGIGRDISDNAGVFFNGNSFLSFYGGFPG